MGKRIVKWQDPYAYLDVCDKCDDKKWVRVLGDGESQVCWKCDTERGNDDE